MSETVDVVIRGQLGMAESFAAEALSIGAEGPEIL
jgi:hypothetical protein